MKTFFKKGLITVLAAAMAIASMTTLVGCGPRGEQIDATKTQLHVSNYDGGFGTEWLYAAKDRFTELVKDVSFESGKTGVQIQCFFGSHTYDTKEMSRLIEGTVSEAKELGIDTRTPEEIALMTEEWGR